MPPDTEDLLRAWNAQLLVPTEHDKAFLRDIGATEADLFGNERGIFRFPCRVTLRSSELVDPALVLVTKFFPISRRPAILYSDVAQLAPSAFALPCKIRLATTRADEWRMGFAPTHVESADGSLFILNWSTDVFRHPEISAGNLRFCEESNVGERAACPDAVTRPMAYVYCDWFPEVEQYLVV